ncbi:MAG: IS481 family transposase [Pseudomonadota bacterium]
MMTSTQNKKIINNRLGLLNLAEELGNISKACKVMGFSRDTFYRYREAYDENGVEGLLETNRSRPNKKNRVNQVIEDAVIKFAFDEPAYGQTRVSNELRKKGIDVSPCGVRSIWLRHDLEVFSKRLKSLEVKAAKENLIFTESQLEALERKKEEKLAHGEIETEHPGYLGSQDTFYVGTLKGVGRVYQQTFVDTYSKVSQAKLYNMKTPLTAADLLNDKVIPFFEKEELPLLRILTDRGTEFCGRPEDHRYQLYLAASGIDHTKTKVKHPQTNGICERFHKTILQEFYQPAFRRKVYKSIEELQTDLDQWIEKYNFDRTHSGKVCEGKTPYETLVEGKKVWEEKKLNFS